MNINMRTRAAATVTAAFLAGALAACGSSSDGGNEPTVDEVTAFSDKVSADANGIPWQCPELTDRAKKLEKEYKGEAPIAKGQLDKALRQFSKAAADLCKASPAYADTVESRTNTAEESAAEQDLIDAVGAIVGWTTGPVAEFLINEQTG